MIEARIVEASDTFSRNLGARLSYSDRTTNQIGLPVNGSNPLRLGVGASSATPVAGVGTLSTVLFNNKQTRFLNLELSALQADGKGKIISSPRVITSNQTEATIEDGTEIPYQQASSSGATAVAFKKATLSLKVKPQVTPDDNVIMTLRVSKDSRGEVFFQVPTINTKNVQTEVLVEDGGTVVLGGIYTSEERTDTTKVPVLGDLPYVGFLFKNNQKVDDRRELLVFISPKILKDNLNMRR